MEKQTRGVFTASDLKKTWSLNKPDESWPMPGLEISPDYPPGTSPGDEPAPADVVWLNSAHDKVTQSTALDDARRQALASALVQLINRVESLDQPQREQAQTIINFTGSLVQIVALSGADAKVAATMEATLREQLKDVKPPELLAAVEQVLEAIGPG